jgi:hypothetical protein
MTGSREAEEKRWSDWKAGDPKGGREAKLAQLSQEGRLLYQLVERVDALFEVQQEQARYLAGIKSAVTIIAVLMVLAVIVGVLGALLG